MAGARQTSFVFRIAQTIRAILLANATLTNIGGLRVSMLPSQVPGCAAAWQCRLMMKLLAPMISSLLRERSPILVVASNPCFPPVECCRRVKPSQAAKSRPLRKTSGGGPSEARAVAGRSEASLSISAINRLTFLTP